LNRTNSTAKPSQLATRGIIGEKGVRSPPCDGIKKMEFRIYKDAIHVAFSLFGVEIIVEYPYALSNLSADSGSSTFF
jgi:hypothetical protein